MTRSQLRWQVFKAIQFPPKPHRTDPFRVQFEERLVEMKPNLGYRQHGSKFRVISLPISRSVSFHGWTDRSDMAPVYSTKNRNLHRSRFSLIYTLELLGCTKTGCLMIDLKEGKRKREGKKKKRNVQDHLILSHKQAWFVSQDIANIAHIKTSVFKSVCSVYCVRLHVATVHASLSLL